MANTDLRIKELCKKKGITLEMLAERLGILRTSLSQSMSRNSFSIDKLSEIADALDVEIPELFSASKHDDGLTCPNCGAKLTIKVE